MLRWICKNKPRAGSRGQLAPVFIIIIVVILVMIMVTVNLGKVALIKTDTSNSVDAGGLAGGSGMANTFNNVAVANSQLQMEYLNFLADTAVMFTTALVDLAMAQSDASMGVAASMTADGQARSAMAASQSAQGLAFPDPCSAIEEATQAATLSAGASATLTSSAIPSIVKSIGEVELFITTTIAINVAITSFAIAQQFFYMEIRRMAEEGRKNSVRAAHQFVFKNSGTSGKLKQVTDDLPQDILNILKGQPENLDIRNYQEAFRLFMRYMVKDNAVYSYAWNDGQARPHSVTSAVGIDKVDQFKLQTTAMPLPAEIGILGTCTALASNVQTNLAATQGSYSSAAGQYTSASEQYSAAAATLDVACGGYNCCGPMALECCDIWFENSDQAINELSAAESTLAAANGTHMAGTGTNNIAITTIIPIYPTMASAMAGLAPGGTFVSSSSGDSSMFIICWIDDIVHNRKVKVDTLQTHGETRDAEVSANFWRARYPGAASFSIVDFRGNGSIFPPNPTHDSSIIMTDLSMATYDPCSSVRDKVADLENQIQVLLNSANSLDNDAANAGQEANNIDTRLNNLGQDYSGLGDDLHGQADSAREEAANRRAAIEQLIETIKSIPLIGPILAQILESILAPLYGVTDAYDASADYMDQAANDLSGGFNGLAGQVSPEADRVGGASNSLSDRADYLRAQADSIHQEIENYRNTNAQCF